MTTPQRLTTLTLACVICGNLARQASAQSPGYEAAAIGFQRNHAFYSLQPFEHIDTVSGNLVLTFIDLELPGDAGRTLAFQRTYNSRLDGPGWTFGLAGLVMWIDDPATQGTECEECFLPHFHTSDGATHSTIWLNQPNFGPDGHRWVVNAGFWKYDRVERRLYMPDGTIGQYNSDGRLIEAFDPFSSSPKLSLTWNGTLLESVVQSVGGQTRTVSFAYVNGNVDTMSYIGRTWSYVWESVPVGALQIPVLRQVVPPTGAAWQYAYDGDAILNSLRTPAGGEIAYTYDIHQFGREQDVANQIQVNSRVVKTRSIVGTRATNGTWTYDYRNGTPADPCPCERTTIATPDGTTIEYRTEIGGINYVPTLGGDYVMTRRTVTDAQNHEHERESRSYTPQPIVNYTVGGIPEVSQQTITRDGTPYQTTFACDSGQLWRLSPAEDDY